MPRSLSGRIVLVVVLPLVAAWLAMALALGRDPDQPPRRGDQVVARRRRPDARRPLPQRRAGSRAPGHGQRRPRGRRRERDRRPAPASGRHLRRPRRVRHRRPPGGTDPDPGRGRPRPDDLGLRRVHRWPVVPVRGHDPSQAERRRPARDRPVTTGPVARARPRRPGAGAAPRPAPERRRRAAARPASWRDPSAVRCAGWPMRPPTCRAATTSPCRSRARPRSAS